MFDLLYLQCKSCGAVVGTSFVPQKVSDILCVDCTLNITEFAALLSLEHIPTTAKFYAIKDTLEFEFKPAGNVPYLKHPCNATRMFIIENNLVDKLDNVC